MNNEQTENGGDARKDIWYRWLLGRRDGEDSDRRRQTLQGLAPIRDEVLKNARLEEGEILLDVGCGDGLIGFGALASVPDCSVIFSDISNDLLEYCREVADDTGNLHRSRFERLSATDLHTIPDASVDAVTTRSVLIYVADKEKAFAEFHRVLKPGGRFSLFEPINSFTNADRQRRYLGYDLSSVADLYAKVRAAIRGDNESGEKGEEEMKGAASDPMIDFDERDLLTLAGGAGFGRLSLDYHVEIRPFPPGEPGRWEMIYRSAPNPNAPTLEEAVRTALTPPEADAFLAAFRSAVEQGNGVRKSALAFLHGVK